MDYLMFHLIFNNSGKNKNLKLCRKLRYRFGSINVLVQNSTFNKVCKFVLNNKNLYSLPRYTSIRKINFLSGLFKWNNFRFDDEPLKIKILSIVFVRISMYVCILYIINIITIFHPTWRLSCPHSFNWFHSIFFTLLVTVQ